MANPMPGLGDDQFKGDRPQQPEIGVSLVNDSGYSHNQSKFKAMPPSAKLEGFYREEWSEDGDLVAVTRFWKVAWGARGAFAQWAIGYVDPYVPSPSGAPNPSPQVLTRTVPCQDPSYPWLFGSRCALANPRGAFENDPSVCVKDENSKAILGDDGKPIQIPEIAFYDSSLNLDDGAALFEVTYTPRPYTVLTDADALASGNTYPELTRYVDRSEEASLITYPLPVGSLIFPLGGVSLGPNNPGQTFAQLGFPSNVVDDNAAFIHREVRALTHRWVAVPDIPESVIDQCVGSVNSLDFDANIPGWPTRPAGTLLMQPVRRRRYKTVRGRTVFDLIFTFLYSKFGWQALPTASGDYFPCQYSVGGKPLYPTADFNKLFGPVAHTVVK